MDCPVCKTERLALTERSGIEIDYCPKCRGIWLDRGELDKLIERAQGVGTAAPAPAPLSSGHGSGHSSTHHGDRRDSHGRHGKSIWRQIFD